jgi:hypothetical protein
MYEFGSKQLFSKFSKKILYLYVDLENNIITDATIGNKRFDISYLKDVSIFRENKKVSFKFSIPLWLRNYIARPGAVEVRVRGIENGKLGEPVEAQLKVVDSGDSTP